MQVFIAHSKKQETTIMLECTWHTYKYVLVWRSSKSEMSKPEDDCTWVLLFKRARRWKCNLFVSFSMYICCSVLDQVYKQHAAKFIWFRVSQLRINIMCWKWNLYVVEIILSPCSRRGYTISICTHLYYIFKYAMTYIRQKVHEAPNE